MSVIRHAALDHSDDFEVVLACPQCHENRVAEVEGRSSDPTMLYLRGDISGALKKYLRDSVLRQVRQGPLSTSTAREPFKLHAGVKGMYTVGDGSVDVTLTTSDLGVAQLLEAFLEDHTVTVVVGPADTRPLGA